MTGIASQTLYTTQQSNETLERLSFDVIWFASPDLMETVSVVQEAVEAVECWVHRWGLQISDDKTKAMLFTLRRPRTVPPIYFQRTEIEYVNTKRFLGMTLDPKLSWGPHITLLHSRCLRDIQLLRILSNRGWGADFVSLRRF